MNNNLIGVIMNDEQKVSEDERMITNKFMDMIVEYVEEKIKQNAHHMDLDSVANVFDNLEKSIINAFVNYYLYSYEALNNYFPDTLIPTINKERFKERANFNIDKIKEILSEQLDKQEK